MVDDFYKHMKKEQEILDISYKESVRQKRERKKKEKEEEYVWQWYWDYDYLGNKYKAIYFGPRLDWMKLFTKRKKKKK